MCGIIGIVGRSEAAPRLIESLKRLEYRGYDSAGVAALSNGLTVIKTVGKLRALEDLLVSDTPEATAAVAHTRWATHGKPSTPNSHPHADGAGRLAVCHNGIIENYLELKHALEARGSVFASETDTEVIPHLIQSYYEGDFEAAFRQAVSRGIDRQAITDTVTLGSGVAAN